MSIYNRNLKQGFYTPVNPEKYKGNNIKKIIYRSGLELKFMKIIDHSKNVLEWSSESVVIPYVKPTDNQVHRYFMDIYMKKRMRNGSIKEFLIELKPHDFIRPPKPQKRRTKRYIELIESWAVNEAKWKYANDYAMKKGWEFVIVTERDI